MLSQVANDLAEAAGDDVGSESKEYCTVCLRSFNGTEIDLTFSVICWQWLQLAVNLQHAHNSY